MKSLLDIPNDLDFEANDTAAVKAMVAKDTGGYINGQHFVAAKPAPEVFKEICKACGGSGNYRGLSRFGSRCFECKGEGYKVFKSSPAERAKAKEQRHARALTAGQGNLDCFAVDHPEAWAWVSTKAEAGDAFACNLKAGIFKFGGLTERQMSAVHASIQRDIERKAQAEQVKAEAPPVNTATLFESFERATASGLKRPRLHFGSFVVSMAPLTGKNPGALYVKNDDDVYLGKIFEGKFLSSRDCDAQTRSEVISLVENPAAAAKAYGLRTGNCCICNRTLTDSTSVANGIGPICAEKFGF